jgi:hypothetical protein
MANSLDGVFTERIEKNPDFTTLTINFSADTAPSIIRGPEEANSRSYRVSISKE